MMNVDRMSTVLRCAAPAIVCALASHDATAAQLAGFTTELGVYAQATEVPGGIGPPSGSSIGPTDGSHWRHAVEAFQIGTPEGVTVQLASRASQEFNSTPESIEVVTHVEATSSDLGYARDFPFTISRAVCRFTVDERCRWRLNGSYSSSSHWRSNLEYGGVVAVMVSLRRNSFPSSLAFIGPSGNSGLFGTRTVEGELRPGEQYELVVESRVGWVDLGLPEGPVSCFGTASATLVLEPGPPPECSAKDINADGIVNTADLSLLLASFGTACP